jgi:hypothetical protein
MSEGHYYTDKRAVHKSGTGDVKHLVCLCTSKKYALGICRALNAAKDGELVPDRISLWYMHDNHTFTKLKGSMKKVMKKAEELRDESPYGMLCSATLLKGDKEIKRVGISLHARKGYWSDGHTIEEWRDSIYQDLDALRLMEERNGT